MAAFNNNFSYTYFANIKDEDELGRELWQKVGNYRNYIISSGRLLAWRTLFGTYYQEYAARANNYHTGQKGQYAHVNVNEFKSLIDRRRAMLTATRVSFDPVAAQSTVKARAQTEIAKQVLTYYLKSKGLEGELDLALCWGDLLGEAFFVPTWDAHAGKPVTTVVDPNTGHPKIVFDGDFKFAVYDPTRAGRDVHTRSIKDCNWFYFEGRGNKYDEAAKHPDLAQRILDLPPPTMDEVQYHFINPQTTYKTDEIAVFYFFHKRTPSCPAGRYVKFYTNGLVAVSDDLPYADIPAIRYAPQEQLETPFGYSDSWLLAGIQEISNIAYDSMATNIELFGVQSVYAIRGSNLQWEQLSAGAVLLEGSPFPGSTDGAPKALNLLQIPPELPAFIAANVSTMERLTGINATVRGQPPENVDAGVAMAFQQATAVQANANGQMKVTQFYEGSGTSMLNTLKTFAVTPRIIKITGDTDGQRVREFSAVDLDDVEHVFVQLGNPILDSHAGRLAIGQDMVQNGLVTTKEEYLTLIRTGDLGTLTRNAVDELSLIHKEDEQLMAGQPVTVMPTDNHELHEREHGGVGAIDEVRSNPAKYANLIQHINTHRAFEGKPPLAMQPPPPAPPPMPMPPGPPGPAPTQGTPAPLPGPQGAPLPPGPAKPGQTPPGATQLPAPKGPQSGHPGNLARGPHGNVPSAKQAGLFVPPQAQAVDQSVTGVSPLPQNPVLKPRR